MHRKARDGCNDKVVVSVRVRRDTKESLERIAEKDGTSTSAQINIAIARYVRERMSEE